MKIEFDSPLALIIAVPAIILTFIAGLSFIMWAGSWIVFWFRSLPWPVF